ncbi:hypothetical protein M405DRAFT_822359 [Rhizopogon salebrosus TDB-379]|nr:hypothetical protein M405DRAFT_822359 [Rhizopogon salebrosus TDB-379]
MANPPYLSNNWGFVDASAGVAQPAVYNGQPAMQPQVPQQQGSSLGSRGSSKGKRRATDDDAPVAKKKKMAVAPRTGDDSVVQFIEESGGSGRLHYPACQRSFTRSDSLKRHRESLGKYQENQRANALRDLVPGANANEASTTLRAPPLATFAQDVHITVQAQGSGQREASEASMINGWHPPPPPVVAANFSIGVTEDDDTDLFCSP